MHASIEHCTTRAIFLWIFDFSLPSPYIAGDKIFNSDSELSVSIELVMHDSNN
jgi:hypothetical protein